MYRIGEFSRLCRVPVSALRYYADYGLLTPAEVDPESGYRYFSVSQLPRLNRILALKDLGLSLDDIPLGGRILAIADIFEALTASDRPYKKGRTLKEALQVIEYMTNSGHVDPDLFATFIDEKVYLLYAEKYLEDWQIDAGESTELSNLQERPAKK